jgi:hypothetical protein
MYRIIPDTTVSDQIAALPTEALPHHAGHIHPRSRPVSL